VSLARVAALFALFASCARSPAPPAPTPSPTPAPRVLLGPRRWDQVIVVGAPTELAVREALGRVTGPAVVVLPPGRYEISGTLDIKTDDLLLVGAGAAGGDAQATVFARAQDEGEHIVPALRARGTKRTEISGVRFVGFLDPGSKGKGVGVILEEAEDFRVDHAAFEHLGFAGVRTNGHSFGVVDHCTFTDELKPALGTDGYGVAVYGADALEGIPLGDAPDSGARPRFYATFIEDDEFSGCRHAAASNKGGRYVFRHNHVKNGVIAHAVDAHGAEYNSTVGGEWIDVYANTIEQSRHDAPYYDGWAIRVRGGRALVHDNVFGGYRVGVELSQLTSAVTGPAYVWNNTLTTGGPMVKLDPHGPAPTFEETAPRGYSAHPYPHPRAATACARGALVEVGGAATCKE
jgi:hypothetical protein